MSGTRASERKIPKSVGQMGSRANFFDIKVTAHDEYDPAGLTVNSAFYCDVLQ